MAAARPRRAAAQIRQTWPRPPDDALSELTCALETRRYQEAYQGDGVAREAWRKLAVVNGRGDEGSTRRDHPAQGNRRVGVEKT